MTEVTQNTELIAGRYRLLEQIGTGGMGVVWRARDEVLGRTVAIKELAARSAVSGFGSALADDGARRAMREARIAARLHHPNVIGVYDIVDHDGRPFLVMEYLESRSLAQLSAAGVLLPPHEVARIGAQLASALKAAHDAGVVHRDVKPGNVLLAEDGEVKLTDFGISRAVGDATVTASGILLGTLGYIAPEVAQGQPADSRSDVYSLGATLYAASEGHAPFGQDENAVALLYRIVHGELIPARHAGPLEPVLLWMLERDPALRPTMPEAERALRAVESGAEQSAAARLAAESTMPIVADALLADSTSAEPVAPDHAVAEPVAADPVAAEPVAAEPVAAEPVAPDHAASDPITAEPVAEAPVVADSVAAGTASADRAQAQPQEQPQPEAEAEPSSDPRYPVPAPPAPPAPPATVVHEPSARGNRRRAAVIAIGLVAALLLGLGGWGLSTALRSHTAAKPATSSAPANSPSHAAVSPAAPSPSPQPSHSAVPKSSAAAPPVTAPSVTAASSAPPPPSRADQLTATIVDYYRLVPGNLSQAWSWMTPDYQQNHAGGWSGYTSFWSQVQRVTVSDVTASPPSTVTATVDYYYKNGSFVEERTQYGLVSQQGRWLIASSSVLSHRGG